MNDDELMSRLSDGDDSAFSEIVKCHQSPLVGFFHRQLRDWQLSEDLSQETLLRVHATAEKYIPSGTFKAWMYRIARNLLIDTTRRRAHDCLVRAVKSRPRDDDREEVIARLSGELPLPDEQADRRDFAKVVDDILHHIPEDQRLTFILHIYAGLSLPEVAAAMETNLPTTKSRLRLARAKIRESLECLGITEVAMIGRKRSVKGGKDRHGLQRFKCRTCAKTFTEPHALTGKQTSMDETVKVLRMLLEGMSVRSCERLTGIHRDTILALMVQAGESCRRFMEATIVKHPADYIECDEQWAFVGCKRKTAERLNKNPEVCGDRYVFTAIDRDSKLLLCWHAGDRSADDTWRFADKLYAAVSGRPTVNTDGWPSYTSAIPLTFREQVDFAQVIKTFQSSTGERQAQARYSPGSITGIEKKVVCGSVNLEEAGTSRMERFNLTTRMTLRRFTRLTNGHSKKTRNHDAMLGLYFAWYNWCRKHMTIKTTPAVKAGLTDSVWSLERLLTVAASIAY